MAGSQNLNSQSDNLLPAFAGEQLDAIPLEQQLPCVQPIRPLVGRHRSLELSLRRPAAEAVQPVDDLSGESFDRI